jgi:hypothetical protein
MLCWDPSTAQEVKWMNTSRNAPHIAAGIRWVITSIVGVTLAFPTAVLAQDRSRDRREGQGRPERDSRGDRDRNGREDRRGNRDEAHSKFTHSAEGRRFESGVVLRKGTVFTDRHFETYFPHHYYSYPHYVPARASVDVVISPFHFYFGVFPPYIERRHVFVSPPPRVFIEIPIYVGNEYRGYGDYRGDYYLDRRRDDERWKDDRELRRAVYDLEDAFQDDDITLLSELTDPSVKIAIFARGRYEYSLETNDYLDMTRDFMRTAHTSDFVVSRVRPKTRGVYQVFARHSYRSQDGQTRTVYLCVVLERISGRWTITQVDSSPDRIEN